MLTPLPEQKWSFETAAHLLNRAGFGGTPDEIETLHGAGPDAAVEGLLHPPDDHEDLEEFRSWTEPQDLRSQLLKLGQLKGNPEEMRKTRGAMVMEERDEMIDLRNWWLGRMRSTTAPLVEKMALFWHGHFATGAPKVRKAYWMWRQNETFRSDGLGNFKTLLHKISRDPAMMIYLDLAQSRKEHPNENWARELMELFTLGIGHYSEEDIRESARAFTGYRINPTNEQFHFERGQEDTGLKIFLGHSGNFSGDDILNLIVEQPACPEWISHKLCRFFVADEPSPSLVDAVALSLRHENFEIRPVLQELFRSAEFYSDRVVRMQIKSPVQFLIQSCRLLETTLPLEAIAQTALQRMGQLIFAPPNVKGWDGGKSWISTSSLLFRDNFANYLIAGTAGNPNAPAALRRTPIDLARIIPVELRDKPGELIAHLARRLFQTQPNENQTQTFLAYLQSRTPDRGDETMRRLLHLMMSTPQYQLT